MTDELYPKFIVETDPELGDCLVVGKCWFHKELANNVDKVKGGGWWKLCRETNTFTLYGQSDDFGKVEGSVILECIKSGNVYTNKFYTYSIAKKYKFIIKWI